MCCFCLHLYWKPNDYLVGESVHLRDGINALMCLAQAAQLCTSTAEILAMKVWPVKGATPSSVDRTSANKCFWASRCVPGRPPDAAAAACRRPMPPARPIQPGQWMCRVERLAMR